MKNKFLIGNWKTKLNLKESLELAKNIAKALKNKGKSDTELVICPSHMVLKEIGETVKKTPLVLGAQNMFWANRGAYTGEVTPEMIVEAGCRYVIIGHSERRINVIETDEMVNKKVKNSCQMENLTPIICIGETFEQRKDGQKDYVVMNQLKKALDGVEANSRQNIIIAYEPIWAIGSGQTVEPSEAEYTGQVIHRYLIDTYSLEIIKNNFRIIYGGSIDSANIEPFLNLDAMNGVLVGGASVKADEWIKMSEIILSIT